MRSNANIAFSGMTLEEIDVIVDSTNIAKILIHFSKHSDYSIRTSVASNPHTPAEVLEVLSKDPDWGVRLCVTTNPNTPDETLETLSKDSHPFVCEGATEKLYQLF